MVYTKNGKYRFVKGGFSTDIIETEERFEFAEDSDRLDMNPHLLDGWKKVETPNEMEELILHSLPDGIYE